MADGEITVKLDAETEQRLKDAADAAGRSVDDYVRELIVDGLDDDWAEDVRIAKEYDRTGVSYSVEEAMARFDAAMKVQLAKRR
jgi:predicted DNA-binding protein